ncbi:MAG: hypothetical protein LBU76_04005, partial [Azoarcus sp.]|nr:hypothetical protein [Azoarcus sp.]
ARGVDLAAQGSLSVAAREGIALFAHGRGASDVGPGREAGTDLSLGGQARYAVRLAPPGYLYNLIERKGIKYWQSYLVLEDSFLYQLSDNAPPQVMPEFNCARDVCGVDASMIDIPQADEVQNAWLLYSPSAMTAAKLEEYRKNAAAYGRQGRMQPFSPAGWLAKDTEQEHTLLADEVLKTAAEYVLFAQEGAARAAPLGKLLEQQMIPATLDAYAGGSPPDAAGRYAGRLGSLYNTMKRDGYGAVVAHDPIGITQALNDFRNAPLESLQGYLAATDAFGASNQRRMEIFEAIEEIRVGFEQGIIFDTQSRIDGMRKQLEASQAAWDHDFKTRGAMMMANQREVEAKFKKDRRLQEAEFKRALEEAKAEGPKKWREKYASRLDAQEMEAFSSKLNEHTRQAFALAEERVPDHIKWFGSERLKAPSVERKNLYMRGFMFNQEDIIASARREFAEIRAAAGEVGLASEIDAAQMQKMTKGLVSGFKSVDSAFDEWVRNQGKEEFSRRWVQSTNAGASSARPPAAPRCKPTASRWFSTTRSPRSPARCSAPGWAAASTRRSPRALAGCSIRGWARLPRNSPSTISCSKSRSTSSPTGTRGAARGATSNSSGARRARSPGKSTARWAGSSPTRASRPRPKSGRR